MDSTIYTIILSDGTRLENLRLNGNNYISQTPVTKEMFEGNMVPVIISDGIHMETHEYMDLVQITQQDGEYWFILRDVSKEELFLQKMNSNIQYLSMMSGIELF